MYPLLSPSEYFGLPFFKYTSAFNFGSSFPLPPLFSPLLFRLLRELNFKVSQRKARNACSWNSITRVLDTTEALIR